jgi:hypothetical protein
VRTLHKTVCRARAVAVGPSAPALGEDRAASRGLGRPTRSHEGPGSFAAAAPRSARPGRVRGPPASPKAAVFAKNGPASASPPLAAPSPLGQGPRPRRPGCRRLNPAEPRAASARRIVLPYSPLGPI